MDKWVEKVAKDLGAQIVTELPAASAGPIGAAHAAGFYSRRMQELRRQESQTNPANGAHAIPVDELTFRGLQTAAEMLWPHQGVDAAKFGESLVKGLTVLILDQLTKRLEEKKQALQGSIDAKDAVKEAMSEMLGAAPQDAALK